MIISLGGAVCDAVRCQHENAKRSTVQRCTCRLHEMIVHAIESMSERKERKKEKRKEKKKKEEEEEKTMHR